MVLCAFCPNTLTSIPHYEDEYLNRVERYKQSNTAQLFEDALAHQLCMYLQIDIIEIYKRAHPDETMDYTELKDTLRFANWQGVEIIQQWNSRNIDLVIQSIRNINFYQLANELELEVASI